MVKLSKADNIGYFKTKPKVRISFWNFKFDGNENFHFFFSFCAWRHVFYLLHMDRLRRSVRSLVAGAFSNALGG